MPALPLTPRSSVTPGDRGDVAHQGLRLVDVEVVDDEVPAAARRGRSRRVRWMWATKSASVRVGPCGRGDDLAGDDVAVEDEGAGAVADVLELAPLDLARGQRQAGVLALQGLHAGQLVGADHPLARAPPAPAPPGRARRRRPTFASNSGVGRRGQPVADAVRLESPLLSSRAAWRGEMPVHDPALDGLVGQLAPGPLADRPLRAGGCLAGQRDDPADLLGGDAARAAGARRVLQALGDAQLLRRHARQAQPAHPPQPGGVRLDAQPAGDLRRCSAPPAAARTIRARSASCCAVRCAPASASSSRRSAAVSAPPGASGRASPPPRRLPVYPPATLPPAYSRRAVLAPCLIAVIASLRHGDYSVMS